MYCRETAQDMRVWKLEAGEVMPCSSLSPELAEM